MGWSKLLKNPVSGDLTINSSTSLKPVISIENTNADQHNAQLHFIKNSASPAVDDHLGQIDWKGDNNSGDLELFGRIQVDATNVTNGSETGIMKFLTRKTGDSFADRMVIDGEGKVGIGKTSPQATLHISSDATNSSAPTGIYGTTADTHTGLFLGSSGNLLGEKYGMQFGGWSGYAHVGIFGIADASGGMTTGDLTIDFRAATGNTALTERFRFTHEGYLGIGTASPAAALHVSPDNNNNDGDIKVGTRAWFSHRDSSTTKTWIANDYNDNSATFGIRMKGVADGNEVLTITGSGNATFAGLVGIGCTPADVNSTNDGLDIKYNTYAMWQTHGGNTNERAWGFKNSYADAGKFGLISSNADDNVLDTPVTTWDKDGNVTIGNASRKTSLTIDGAGAGWTGADIIFQTDHANRGGGMFIYNTSTDHEWFWGTPYQGSSAMHLCYESTGSFTQQTAETTHSVLNISTGGNATFAGTVKTTKLGIGTAPSHILEIATSDQFYGDFNTTLDTGAYLSFQIDGADVGYLGSRYNLQAATSGYEDDFMLRANGGHLVLQSGTSKTIVFNTNNSNLALTLDSSQHATFAGNVGIGKSPDAQLNLSQAGGSNIRFDNPTTSRHFVIGEGVGSPDKFSFRGLGYRYTDTLTVDFTNNRVGVNNISPTNTLEVDGTFEATGNATFGGDVTTTGTLAINRANDSSAHISLGQSEGSGVTYNILSDDAGNFTIREAADTRFTINTSGNATFAGAMTATGITSNSVLTINNGTSSLYIAPELGGMYMTVGSNEYLRFLYDAGSSEAMRIIDGGKVGIGETAPDGKLHVKGDSGAGTVTADSAGDDLIVEAQNGGMTIMSLDAGDSSLIWGSTSDNIGVLAKWNYDANAFRFRTSRASAKFVLGGGNGANQLTLDGTNVGIGTESPEELLDIQSSVSNTAVRIMNKNADATPARLNLVKDGGSPADNDIVGQLEFYNKDDGDNWALFGKYRVESTDVSNTSEDGTMIFSTAVAGTLTDNITIKGGNVGIGTTSPGYPLQISTSTAARGLYVAQTYATGTVYGAMIEAEGASTTNIGLLCKASNATNNYGLIVSAGNVGIGITDPDEMLEVAGNIKTTGLGGGLQSETPSDTNPTVLIQNNYASTGLGGLGSADRLALICSGDTMLVLDEENEKSYFTTHAGNVGIGTDSPAVKFHVVGGSVMVMDPDADPHYYIGESTSGGTWGGMKWKRSSDLLQLGMGPSSFDAALTINESLNVGIGTESPTQKLTVSDDASTGIMVQSFGTGVIPSLNLYGARGTEASPSATQSGDIIGQLTFGGFDTALSHGALIQGIAAGEWGTSSDATDDPTDLAFRVAPDGGPTAEVMRIASTGKVGIGVTDPDHPLEIKGGNDSGLKITDSSGGNIMIFQPDGGGDAQGLFYNSSNVAKIRLNADGDSYFIGGNVGIGTSSPASPLHIKQANDGGATEIILDNSAAGDSTDESAAIRFRHNGATAAKIIIDRVETFATSGSRTAKMTFQVVKDDTANNAMTILESGNVGIGITTPSSKLYVKETAANVWAGVFKGTSTAANYGLSIDCEAGTAASSQPFQIYPPTGGSVFAIDGYGKVGIGTTSPINGLHVKDGQILIEKDTDTIGGQAILYFKTDSQDTSARRKGAILFQRTDSYGVGDMYFCVDSAADGGDATTADAKLVIKGSGNVGIGTSSPHLVDGYNTSTANTLNVYDASAGARIAIQGTDASLDLVDTGSDEDYRWFSLYNQNKMIYFRRLETGASGTADMLTLNMADNAATFAGHVTLANTYALQWGDNSARIEGNGSTNIVDILCAGTVVAKFTENGGNSDEQLQLTDGKATRPSLSFIGDIDTGMYRITTDHIGFSTAGVEAFRLTDSQNAQFAGDISTSGTILAGSDGYPSRIKVLPFDFIPNDDSASAEIVSNDGESEVGKVNVTSASLETHANYNIPKGFKVTHCMLYGSDTANVVKIYEAEITDGDAVEKGAGVINTEINCTDFNATDTNYIIMKWSPTATDDFLYGGYVTIAKI